MNKGVFVDVIIGKVGKDEDVLVDLLMWNFSLITSRASCGPLKFLFEK